MQWQKRLLIYTKELSSNNYQVGNNFDTTNDGTDTDSDEICDLGDTDDDNDGYSDADELTCGNTNALLNTSKPTDTDSDFLCNGVDTDDDNDGIEDTSDPFSFLLSSY